jgi:hypothetical protein
MPKYYFQVDDGASDPGGDGIELADLKAAKCEAVKYAGRLICDAHTSFWHMDDWRLTVANEDGLTLFTLIFASVDSPFSVAARAATR